MLTEDEATAIAANLAGAVRSTQPGTIRRAFTALASLDGYRIARLAMDVLDETDLATVAQPGASAAERAHRAAMDVFYGSLYAYLSTHADGVDQSVEHDVPSWIEANAPALMSANLARMEAALPDAGAQRHRTLVEFHQRIDLDACESEQNRILQATWGHIEAAIAVRLGAAGNEAP